MEKDIRATTEDLPREAPAGAFDTLSKGARDASSGGPGQGWLDVVRPDFALVVIHPSKFRLDSLAVIYPRPRA